MILYHFVTSPFARRVRLALAHKGLSAELRDARANPDHLAEVRRLNPVRTVPVLVDGQRVVRDSSGILHYLDRKHPDPPLWPPGLEGAAAFELGALVDTAIHIIVDLGTRVSVLSDHPKFPVVREELVGRAQAALDHVARAATARAGAPGAFLCGDRWSAADMTLLTAVTWLEGLPVRAATYAPARDMVALGWTLPAGLAAWADRHRGRADVVALG